VDEAGVVAGTSSAGEGTVATAAGTDFERKQRKEMKAYWLPSFTPDVKKTVNKPDSASKCPCVRTLTLRCCWLPECMASERLRATTQPRSRGLPPLHHRVAVVQVIVRVNPLAALGRVRMRRR
jgi:hypothetical protein